jgi:hypothetical protein
MGCQPMTDIPLFPRALLREKSHSWNLLGVAKTPGQTTQNRGHDRAQRRRRLLVLRDERYQPERPQGHAGRWP